MHLRVSCHLVIGPQCRVGQPPGMLDHEYFSHTDRRQEKSKETETLHSVHLEPQYDSITVLPQRLCSQHSGHRPQTVRQLLLPAKSKLRESIPIVVALTN